MKHLCALFFFVFSFLFLYGPPPVVAQGSASVPSPQGKGWTCRGAVTGCTSPKHPGAEHGCADEIGYGDTEGSARRNGAEVCETYLESIHGGGFYCRDTDAMQCQEMDDPNRHQ